MPDKVKIRYDQVLKKFPKKVKRARSQENLKAAYDRVGTPDEQPGDDMVGRDDNGRYYLD
jgi:hypothetical protein